MNRLLLLLVTLVVTLTLAACGGDGTTVSTGDGDGDGNGNGDGDDPTSGLSGEESGDDDLLPVDPDAPIQFGSYPIGELAVEITHPDGSVQTYVIGCLGDTATLTGDIDTSGDRPGAVTADVMCTRLADPAVQQRLVDGPPADEVCTLQFGSGHKAVLTGRLDDQPIDTEVDRADGCGIADWDGLLADILPAVG